MSQEVSIKALGLVTDPNPREVPSGAMSSAVNVALDREGVLEPRPGFSWGEGKTTPAVKPTTLAPFGSQVVAFLNTTAVEEASGGAINGTLKQPDISRKYVTMQARNNLYVTNDPGPLKVSPVGGTIVGQTWQLSGMPRGTPVFGASATPATGNAPLQPGNAVAYCVCFSRTDSTGYVVRGAPSGVVRFRNAGASAVAMTLSVPLSGLPNGWINTANAQDYVEVYRSAQGPYATVEPPDDMNLVFSRVITAADIAAGTILFTDQITDDFMVAQPALYAGPSQEGILASNYPPPWTVDMAYLNNCAFYAQAKQTARFTLTIGGALDPLPWNGTLSVSAGNVTVTGATTAVLNSGGPAGGPKIGMCINDTGTTSQPTVAGSLFQAETIITNVVGAGPYTLTLSKNATIGGPIGCLIWNVVSVGAQNFYASNVNSIPTREFSTVAFTANSISDTPVMNFCYIVNQQFSNTVFAQPLPFGLTAARAGSMQVEFTAKTLAASQAGYYQSGGDNSTTNAYYTPQDFYGNTSVRFVDTNQPGTMWMSKPYLPEAVPIAYQVTAGDAYKKIIKILPVRTALWIFKEDGLFRLTGNSYDTVNVDLIDPSVQIVHGEAADSMDDTVYAWTTRGLVRIGDGGMEEISRPKIGDALQIIEQALSARGTSNFGIFVRCDPTAKRVYMAVPSAAGQEAASTLYVYSAKTGAFATWTPWYGTPTSSGAFGTGLYTLAFSQALGGMMGQCWNTASGGRRVLMQQKAIGSTGCRSDASDPVNIISATVNAGGTYDIVTSGAPPTTLLGGVICAGDYINGATVISVTSPTIFVTDVSPGTGVQQVYRAFACDMTFQPWQGGARFYNEKIYRDCQLSLDRTANLSRISVTFPSPTGTYVATMGKAVTSIVKRFGFPRSAARVQLFTLDLTITQAWAEWDLNGVTVSYDIGGRTTGR